MQTRDKDVSPERQVVSDLLPGAWEHLPGVVGLHSHHLDVEVVPGQRLEDGQLGALYVEAEVVDGEVAQGHDEAVQGQTLHIKRVLPSLPRYASRAVLHRPGREGNNLRPGLGGQAGRAGPDLPLSQQSLSTRQFENFELFE